VHQGAFLVEGDLGGCGGWWDKRKIGRSPRCMNGENQRGSKGENRTRMGNRHQKGGAGLSTSGDRTQGSNEN